MKVWLTKHALTSGIEEAEVTVSTNSPSLVSYGEGYAKRHFHKPDWHDNRSDAVAAAEQIRDSRIAELVLEVNRLKAVRF